MSSGEASRATWSEPASAGRYAAFFFTWSGLIFDFTTLWIEVRVTAQALEINIINILYCAALPLSRRRSNFRLLLRNEKLRIELSFSVTIEVLRDRQEKVKKCTRLHPNFEFGSMTYVGRDGRLG